MASPFGRREAEEQPPNPWESPEKVETKWEKPDPFEGDATSQESYWAGRQLFEKWCPEEVQVPRGDSDFDEEQEEEEEEEGEEEEKGEKDGASPRSQDTNSAINRIVQETTAKICDKMASVV